MRQLDTNIVIAYLNGNPVVANKLNSHLPDVAISSLVLAELLYGARASTRVQENMSRVHAFTRIVKVLDFDGQSAEYYSEIRFFLRQQGRPTGEIDMQIAAIAVAYGAVLVTHNVRHFQNIPGLVVEDWLS